MKKIYLTLVLSIFTIISYANDFYWVGGSGKWSELFHWATTSGGSVYHSAIPDADDNIYFDANSFSQEGQTIEIDPQTAYCKNISWEGVKHNPEIKGNGLIFAYGSFILTENLQFNFTGKISFQSENSNFNIKTAGNTLNCSLEFAGNNSNWTFDKFHLKEKLIFSGNNSTYNFPNSVILEKKAGDFSGINGGFKASGNNCKIYFNKKLTAAGEIQLTGTKTIIEAKNAIDHKNKMLINGENSEIHLFKEVITEEINIQKGIFTTENQLIKCNKFISKSSEARTLNLGLSDFELGVWEINSNNLTFNMNDNTITFTTGGKFKAGANLKYHDVIFKKSAEIITNKNKIDYIVVTGNATLEGDDSEIKKLELKEDAKFKGNYITDNLILTQGMTYTVNAGKKQSIRKQLDAEGSCKGYIYIKSSEKKKLGTIDFKGTTYNIDYLILRDIESKGKLIANNSIDLDNNPGWTINENPAKTLYWVGDAEDFEWNNADNWSFTSGGKGGACLPSPRDNVIFDKKSFFPNNKIVNTIFSNSFCNNMNWEGATEKPFFSVKTLNIYGSLNLIKEMEANVKVVRYEATETGKTVKTAGHKLDETFFDGIGGAWTLEDDYETKELHLLNGHLNTNDVEVSCTKFTAMPGQNSRELTMGNSVFNVSEDWLVSAADLKLNAGTSHIKMSGNDKKFDAGDKLIYNDVTFTKPKTNGTLNGNKTTFNNVTFNGIGSINGKDNIFGKVHFKQNGSINKNQTYNTLELTPLKIYKIEQASRQTIKEKLIADGGCSGFVTIKSSQPGTTAYFVKNKGKVECNYIRLTDIGAEGGAVFHYFNLSVDSKNYPGWTAGNGGGTAKARTLYWVGKGGAEDFWTNTENWSFTSGGEGGECTPTRIDDVIFDENSFTSSQHSVTISIEFAECKNMYWTDATNNPTFENKSSNKRLSIYGELHLSPNMKMDKYNGMLMFISKEKNVKINCAGIKIGASTVRFNSQGENLGSTNAEWILKGGMNIKRLEIERGTIKTNGNKIKTAILWAKQNDDCAIILQNSDLYIGSDWTTRNGFSLDREGQSKIVFTANSAILSYSPNGKEYHFPKVYFYGKGVVSTGTPYEKSFFEGLYFNIKNKGSKSEINLSDFSNVNTNDFAIEIDTLICNKTAEMNFCKGLVKHAEFKAPVTLNNSKSYDNVYKFVRMLKNGTINGNNSFDSLIFTAGQTYFLEAGKKQTINKYFECLANKCKKIVIMSKNNGEYANIYSKNAKIKGYYLRLTDLNAFGGAKFYAGGDSEDNAIRTNGWTFANPPGYIYGFGKDIIALASEEVILDSKGFNTEETATYLWNTGETTAKIIAKKAMKYKLKVDFGNCPVFGEINLHFAETDNVACMGANNGSIKINSDKTAVYSFNWTDANGNDIGTGNEIKNLAQGDYKIKITEAGTSKTAEKTIRIKQADNPLTLSLDYKNKICNEVADLYITPSGGAGLYSFYLDDKTTALTTNIVSVNPKFKHKITVVDKYACSITDEKDAITPPEPITITPSFTKALKCHGDTEWEAEFNISGGNGTNYTYYYNNKRIKYPKLDASKYVEGAKIKVEDENKCFSETDFKVEPIAAISVTYEILQNPLCANKTDGKIKLKTKGGTKPFSFIANGEKLPSDTPDNLRGNTLYNIVATDANNCPANKLSITLNEPDKIEINTKIDKQPSCYDSSDGIIDLNIKGGTKDYKLKIDNKIYTLTQKIKNISRGEHKITITDKNGCEENKNIIMTAADKFEINLQETQSLSCHNSNNGQIKITGKGGVGTPKYYMNNILLTSNIKNNLSSGIYTFNATDENNCPSETKIHELKAPSPINIKNKTAQNVCGKQKGWAEIGVTGGTPDYKYKWNIAGSPNSNYINNLESGINYKVEVTDANNCPSASWEFILSEATEVTVSQNNKNLKCYGDNSGEINITAKGGKGDLKYSINGKDWQPNGYFHNLKADNYNLLITDDYGCKYEFQYQLSQPEALEIELIDSSAALPGVPNGFIEYNISGGTGNKNISWLNEKKETIESTTNIFAGKYQANITDEKGCKLSYEIKIPEWAITIPNLFSPNNDNENDLFIINGPKSVQLEVKIFNRWGKKITEWTGTKNYWDGLSDSGKEAPDGVYYYSIKIPRTDLETKEYRGFFHLFR